MAKLLKLEVGLEMGGGGGGGRVSYPLPTMHICI